MQNGFTHYTPASGIREAREAVAGFVTRMLDADVDANDVVLVPGSGEVTVNGKTLAAYFPRPTLQSIALAPLRISGTGLLDCHLYRQNDHLILHLVNLTNANTWKAPIDELIPVGPFRVEVRLPNGIAGRSAKTLVSAGSVAVSARQGWAQLSVKSITDHEVVVLT